MIVFALLTDFIEKGHGVPCPNYIKWQVGGIYGNLRINRTNKRASRNVAG